MRIARTSETALEPMATDTFSGSVRRRDMGPVAEAGGTALVVSFEPGVRTHWHFHRGGQVVYVLEGVGRVATRDGDAVEILPGDLLEAPANEEHWHGAAAGAPMTHLSLAFGETVWQEPVTGD